MITDEMVMHFVIYFDMTEPVSASEVIAMSDRLSHFQGAISMNADYQSGTISMSVKKPIYQDVIDHVEEALIDTFDERYDGLMIALEMFPDQ